MFAYLAAGRLVSTDLQMVPALPSPVLAPALEY